MNEDVQKKLMDYLESLESVANKTGDFAIEQAPLVAKEIITWELWSHAFGALSALAVIALCVLVSKRLYKNATKDGCDIMDSPIAPPLIFVMSIIGAIASFAFVFDVSKVIKTQVAPRLIIIEKLAEFM
jgi:hypothetical protein